MDATGIRDEIARLEEAGRACTTERDAHRIDIGIERLEAELAALAPAAHHAARRRPTMGPKCMQATRARTGDKLLDLVARLRSPQAATDPVDERREIVRAAEVLETLAQDLRNAADPNIE
ncbi:MAG: hypothetical protein GX595_18945 [Lentisphaerae bacterium]|nr:hypothetical protein [Lentisphaerota bacterium]